MLTTRARVRDDRVLFFAHDAFVELAVTISFVMSVNALLAFEICDRVLLNVVFIVSAIKALSKLAVA